MTHQCPGPLPALSRPSLKHPASGSALESLPLAGPVSQRLEGPMSNSSVPRGPGLFEVGRADAERKITNVRRIAGGERAPGSVLIGSAAWLLALVGGGALYVCFSAQRRTCSASGVSMWPVSSRRCCSTC